ncbi:hypothetical protein DSO57_1025167 [Entomophthora muscae]|uniref:Uncharacterized protein n=1 Tax=Entomophthora muscae TaxID=34485 RepID=A0ACC2T2J3_9FUNG|nr:hypothetical protein DSO57_1025167 [Entomophthora muscae]
MWIWMVIPHHLETASYYPAISVTPSSLLLFPWDLLASGEAVVKSLTCDDLNLHSAELILPTPDAEGPPPSPSPLQDKTVVAPLPEAKVSTLAPSRAPWLVTGLTLMRLNSYFPQLSLTPFLWSPLRGAVPVIYWAASWWFVSPG